MSTINNKQADKFCKFINHGLIYNKSSLGYTVSPCCYFSRNDSLDIDRDFDIQIDQHRQQWNNDQWSETCRICLDLEKSGQYSYRQASFDAIPDDVNDVALLTVAVTKQCNLACASCGPDSSSFWYRQNLRDGVEQPESVVQLHKEDRQERINKKFLDVFKTKTFDDLRYIKFGGGEPLMSSMHEDILRSIANPSSVTIQYTSNFTLEPLPRVYDLWSQFKLVKWCASIDGIGNQFELLRWPHKWQDLVEFISRVKDRTPHNVMFGVEHTLNPLNVWYVDQFRDWFEKEFACNRYGDRTDLNLHLCVGNMSFAQTPPALRQEIFAKYGKNDPVVILLQQNPYPGKHDALVSWMDQLDSRRNTHWRNTFAEVSNFFD